MDVVLALAAAIAAAGSVLLVGEAMRPRRETKPGFETYNVLRPARPSELRRPAAIVSHFRQHARSGGKVSAWRPALRLAKVRRR